MSHKSCLLLTFLAVTLRAQDTGKLVKVAQTAVRQHSVHVLVCTTSEPQVRIVLSCTSEINGKAVASCVQPLAGDSGYMKDLPSDNYVGKNVSVDWQDNKTGVYQVQDSTVEKCVVDSPY